MPVHQPLGAGACGATLGLFGWLGLARIRSAHANSLWVGLLLLVNLVSCTAEQDEAPVGVIPTTPVDRVLKELPLGNVVYNAPSAMEYKKGRTLEVILSRSHTIEELQARLQDNKELKSITSVQISERMGAELTGVGFTITTLGPMEQTVLKANPVRWAWRVTPTDYGTLFLHLSLYLFLHVDGIDRPPLVYLSEDRSIQVEITGPQRVSAFVEKNWQWLCSSLFFPAVWYAWFRWRKRAREAEGHLGI